MPWLEARKTGKKEKLFLFMLMMGVACNPASAEVLKWISTFEDTKESIDNSIEINSPYAAAFSGDGRHLYVSSLELDPVLASSTSSISAFSINGNSGQQDYGSIEGNLLEVLTQGDVIKNGAGESTKLTKFSSPWKIVSAKDGRYIYVLSRYDNAIIQFERELSEQSEQYGKLVKKIKTYELDVNLISNPHDAVVSPDGVHIYVVGDYSIVAFDIEAESGELTRKQSLVNGVGGVSGLYAIQNITISPDGRNIYVTSRMSDNRGKNALHVFSRDSREFEDLGTTNAANAQPKENSHFGEFKYTASIEDGKDGIVSMGLPWGVKVSPDNKHVYVTSKNNNAINLFERNLVEPVDSTVADSSSPEFSPETQFGFPQFRLSYFTSIERLQYDWQDFLSPMNLDISADGKRVYVALFGDSLVDHDGGVAIFNRNAANGRLTLIAVDKHDRKSNDALNKPQEILLNSTGDVVYLTSIVGEIAAYGVSAGVDLKLEPVNETGDVDAKSLDVWVNEEESRLNLISDSSDEYTFRVTNTSSKPAHNVKILMIWPDFIELENASSQESACSVNKAEMLCQRPDLASGDQIVITAKAHVAGKGHGIASIDVFSDEVDESSEDNSALTKVVSGTPPEAADDFLEYIANVPLKLLENDSDIDDDEISLDSVEKITEMGGVVSFVKGGKEAFYFPPEDFKGRDSFGYTITDSDGYSASAMAYVFVGVPVVISTGVEEEEEVKEKKKLFGSTGLFSLLAFVLIMVSRRKQFK